MKRKRRKKANSSRLNAGGDDIWGASGSRICTLRKVTSTCWKFPSRGRPCFCSANSYVYLGNSRVSEKEGNTIIRGFWTALKRRAEKCRRRKGKENEKKDGTRRLVDWVCSWPIVDPKGRGRREDRVNKQVLRSLEKWISHRFRTIFGPIVDQKWSLTCVKTPRERILVLSVFPHRKINMLLTLHSQRKSIS